MESREMVSVDWLEEYQRDLKRLSKKYRTLKDDMDVLLKVLKLKPNANPIFSFQIDGLGLETCVIKVKKIASRSFKGKGVNSGFRLVYAYFEDVPKITLIELYHKSEKETEDRNRILRYFI